jgi:hypothetical protein
MARKVDSAPALPDGYSFPAMPRKMVDESGDANAKRWLADFEKSSATGDMDTTFQLNQ